MKSPPSSEGPAGRVAPDRNRVKLEGVGVWVEMWVDAPNDHATGDIPILGKLLDYPPVVFLTFSRP
jgi:hypothetical protein